MARPNLLVIMSDQHNPHVAGYAGESLVRTPNLDRLAARGVTFEQTYCPGPLCVPSRMAFVTGLYPRDLGIWTNGGRLDSDTPTFGHQLSLAGYETTLCGRMHFVGPDQQHGFDRRLVGDVSGAMEGRPEGGMFEGVWDPAGCGQGHRSLDDAAAGAGVASYAVYDDSVTERACRFLQDRGQGGEEQPFCMVVGFLLPHNPYVCPTELLEEYMDKLAGWTPPEACPPGEHPALVSMRRTRGVENITPEQARRGRAAYFGLVTLLDRNLGLIMEALAEAGLTDDTVVAYTSDHGELGGEHGMWWKDCFYDGSVKVPMLWSCPSRFRQGRRVNAVAGLLDVAPTLLELGGADPLPGQRGASLLGFLDSDREPADWPDAAFAETWAREQRPARMIRAGKWKLNVYDGYEAPQLFDMEADPGETNDLGADKRFADVRRELLERVLAGWAGSWQDGRDFSPSPEQAEIARRWREAGPHGECERWPFPTGCNVRV